jgi:hypothetical protein
MNIAIASWSGLFALLLASPWGAAAVEIRHYPGDSAIVLPMPGEGVPPALHSAILHNVALVNTGTAPVEVGTLTLTLLQADRVRGVVLVHADELAAAAQTWSQRQQAGILQAYDDIFQTSRFLDGVPLAGSASLPPGTALLLTRIPLVYQADADAVAVSARSVDGSELAARRIPLRVHASPNDYVFPLRGRWFIAAGPGLQSHHRWAIVQEFALDIVAFGDGTTTHAGDGRLARMYHAFGAPVLAAAAGTVVTAVDRFGDDDSLRRADETEAAFEQRAAGRQGELLALGMAGIIGNHVVIDHGNGEFGYYAHLRQGSVAVREGDRVTAGQTIGALGNSGNSTQPHLHFHVADSANPSAGRSLPVVFRNVRVWENQDAGSGILTTGHIVETTD